MLLPLLFVLSFASCFALLHFWYSYHEYPVGAHPQVYPPQTSIAISIPFHSHTRTPLRPFPSNQIKVPRWIVFYINLRLCRFAFLSPHVLDLVPLASQT